MLRPYKVGQILCVLVRKHGEVHSCKAIITVYAVKLSINLESFTFSPPCVLTFQNFWVKSMFYIIAVFDVAKLPVIIICDQLKICTRKNYVFPVPAKLFISIDFVNAVV